MKVTTKWRPSLAFMIALVVGILVLLPFAAMMAARITNNQFVRETEANLHAQAAIYGEFYAQAFRRIEPNPMNGTDMIPLHRERLGQTWHPIEPVLVSSSSAILPPRPDPLPDDTPVGPAYSAIAADLSLLATNAQKTTLVGVLALDFQGRVVAGTGSDLGSFLHVDEVANALAGDIVSVARWREDEYRNHSLRSVSRDTKFRVYVAHPVIVSNKIIGAVYLSRTPSNLNKYLFQQRNTFLWLLGSVLLSATVIGLFLWRVLTRPLHQLQEQARSLAEGASSPHLPSYGLRELASLGQSLMDMGASLRKKSAAIETYTKHATHELKSPVTSIMGAAELLENAKVADNRRLALAATIKADAARMDRLLARMRDMVRGQAFSTSTQITLEYLTPALGRSHPALDVEATGDVDTPLPLSEDAAKICLTHILQNAEEHGANTVSISCDAMRQSIEVQDNGAGISEANLGKVSQPFFTTKREQGGTGMGLSICAEIVAQFGGRLEVRNTDGGALIALVFSDN